MKTLVLAVIGHVDHGKTRLVTALTGMQTDRLAEEQRRGLSIVPGFAHRSFSGGVIDFVDLPGHADFVRATVMGLGGAGAVLIVVSAREGIQAQTHEHLLLARLLGIPRAIVAITQCDGVAVAEQEEVARSVRALVQDGPFEAAPILCCSARTGEGISALLSALETVLAQTDGAGEQQGFWLPVDRVFTVPGRGTVVTGTLLAGPLAANASVTVAPSGVALTVREVQTRGAGHAQVPAGSRVAVNLRGAGSDAVKVGDVLCAPGAGLGSRCLDVELRDVDGVRPVQHMEKLRVLIGTAQTVARVRRGTGRAARLEFDTPMSAFAGQRAVLRRLSPGQTCAGIKVLDPVPTARWDKAHRAVVEAAAHGPTRTIAAAYGTRVIPLAELARLARVDESAVQGMLGSEYVAIAPGLLVSRKRARQEEHALLSALAAYHQAHPLRPVVLRDVFKGKLALLPYLETELNGRGLIGLDHSGLWLAGHNPIEEMSNEDRQLFDAAERALLQGGARPPSVGNPDFEALLLHEGRAVRLHNVALGQWVMFHRRALVDAAQTLRESFDGTFTTGQARALLQTSRKFIVPLLEHFDSTGITKRDGEVRRIAGDWRQR